MRTTKQKQQKARKTLRDRRVWSAGSSIRNAQRALRKPKPVEITVVPSPVYTAYNGKSFRFNDHVCVEMLFGVPDEERTGRLVQVRKGCGQFGSDLYFIRLRDESLMTFENAMIRKVDDTEFEDIRTHASQRQNKQEAFKRMASTDQFKNWVKIESSRWMLTAEERRANEASEERRRQSIEDSVEAMMTEENLKVEMKDDKGRWVPYVDTVFEPETAAV